MFKSSVVHSAWLRGSLFLIGVFFSFPALVYGNHTPDTADVLARNGGIRANIDPAGDVDWSIISLESGEDVEVFTIGSTDTYMCWYDGITKARADQAATCDDDGGFGTNARITRHVNSGGTFYIKVRGFSEQTTGPYELHSRVTAPFSVSYSGPTPSSAQVGERSTIGVTITNSGTTTIPRLWIGVDIHAPDGTKVENTRTPIADEPPPAGTGRVGVLDFSNQGLDLGGGSARTFSATYSFDRSVTGHRYSPGSYTYRFRAWAGGYPGQAGAVPITTLQSRGLSMTTPAPCNLDILSIDGSPNPLCLTGDSTLTATATVRNTGRLACSFVEIRFWLSRTTPVTTNDCYIGRTFFDLTGGGQGNFRIETLFPGCRNPGRWYIGVDIPSEGEMRTRTGALRFNSLMTWYRDLDRDGFGTTAETRQDCTRPDGFADNSRDCDDNNFAINPNTVWYEDRDRDGFGSDNSRRQCRRPAGSWVLNSDDCDDGNASINPNTVWYEDRDRDGFGTSNNSIAACHRPDGYANNSNDCDDNNSQANPGIMGSCEAVECAKPGSVEGCIISILGIAVPQLCLVPLGAAICEYAANRNAD